MAIGRFKMKSTIFHKQRTATSENDRVGFIRKKCIDGNLVDFIYLEYEGALL